MPRWGKSAPCRPTPHTTATVQSLSSRPHRPLPPRLAGVSLLNPGCKWVALCSAALKKKGPPLRRPFARFRFRFGRCGRCGRCGASGCARGCALGGGRLFMHLGAARRCVDMDSRCGLSVWTCTSVCCPHPPPRGVGPGRPDVHVAVVLSPSCSSRSGDSTQAAGGRPCDVVSAAVLATLGVHCLA